MKARSREDTAGPTPVEGSRSVEPPPAGAAVTDPSLSAQSDPGTEPPLERVGHYVVEGEIGRGGMGIVYRARDERLGRSVAIKSLPLLFLDDPRRRGRFEREAKLLALVNHPGIAAIHAVHDEGGRPFLILEYVPGESLAERLRRAPLPLRDALAFGSAIAEALEAAHGRGVVHRDLKPANVRITPVGEVKVLDFGLAKVLGDELDESATASGSTTPLEETEGAGAEDSAPVSRPGALLGSPGYASPEQARGERSDRRADVWAFGCVLFECLTGRKLWGEGTAQDRLRAAALPAPLEQLPEATPPRIRRLLEHCLEKDAWLRLEGLGEARREIEESLAELGAGREPRTPKATPPPSLPISLTPFVGRAAERAAVAALLDRARLVTLTGLGGVGKTRLALGVAEDLAARFPEGVWFVDLAPLLPADPQAAGPVRARVAAAVAKAAGIHEVAGFTLEDALRSELAAGDRLLVLDSCEGAAEAVASLAAALLPSCPGLRILATSRRPLAGTEEVCFPVPPLVDEEALMLFVARAAVAVPGFALGDGNRAALRDLVGRVAGIPLALELAAARLRVLTIEQLAHRLDDRLAALGRSSGPRRETLRELVSWSYEGLAPSGRTLLLRLGVFAGSFTLEAAEEVCAGEGMAETAVLDALMELADWALVAVEKRRGDVRYRLLVPVRELAREQLRREGGEDAVQRRHLAAYLALAERSAEQLLGPDQAAWLERLELELDDFDAALRFAAAHATSRETGLLLATALEPFWRLSYRLVEGRGHLERLLAAGAAAGNPALQERALNAAGGLAYLLDDLRASWRLHEEALALADAVGSKQGRSRALHGLALVAFQDGALAAARARWLERLDLCREIGDRHGITTTLNDLGSVEYRAGDVAAARAYREQSLALARSLGDASRIAGALANLALLDVGRQGDHERARALLEESLALREKIHDRRNILGARASLARIDMSEDPGAARRALEEVLAAAREIDARDVIGDALCSLCLLARLAGEPGKARQAGVEGLRMARRTGDRVLLLTVLEALIRLDIDGLHLGRAARLLGAADGARMARAIVRDPDQQEDYEEDVARLRAGLGDWGYMAARSSGMALGLDRAVHEALVVEPAAPAV